MGTPRHDACMTVRSAPDHPTPAPSGDQGLGMVDMVGGRMIIGGDITIGGDIGCGIAITIGRARDGC